MFKKYFIFILLAVLSLRPAYYVGNVLYYTTHVNEIVKKYCINKDKPTLKCNGKCHLAKQLNGASEQNKTIAAITEISIAFFPVYYQKTQQFNIVDESILKPHSFCFRNATYQFLLSKNIHRPPIV